MGELGVDLMKDGVGNIIGEIASHSSGGVSNFFDSTSEYYGQLGDAEDTVSHLKLITHLAHLNKGINYDPDCKEFARFISEPVYHEVQFMKFYKATLENKDGNFACSFGEKHLQNYSREKKVCFLKLETIGKESKEKAIQNKELLKKELTEKAKIIIKNLENPRLRFLVSNFAKNQVILDNNLALNHLKNIYVDLTKIDLYYLLKDIQERIKILEKLIY
ncbi:6194_t:CDS:2 [Funneliformis geosporum]|uniref:6194_t:CDS:1 n=1 Tax=Funneliformis geosporum TaxID=1117311 RepID=A0A9W4WXV0_9GLOM|nr:6194_t:CDS:2 [Funneliformis geosporum]